MEGRSRGDRGTRGPVLAVPGRELAGVGRLTAVIGREDGLTGHGRRVMETAVCRDARVGHTLEGHVIGSGRAGAGVYARLRDTAAEVHRLHVGARECPR